VDSNQAIDETGIHETGVLRNWAWVIESMKIEDRSVLRNGRSIFSEGKPGTKTWLTIYNFELYIHIHIHIPISVSVSVSLTPLDSLVAQVQKSILVSFLN
jgi:hypothetical protein